MTEEINDNEFKKMLEESFNDKHFDDEKVYKGAVIEGTVIKITADDIFLDIGLKTEGVISKHEFSSDNIPSIGAVIKAVVTHITPTEISLSFEKAQNINSFEQLKTAYEHELSVSAQVEEVIKGGFTAMIDKFVKAFVPISQIDVIHVHESIAPNYVGKTFDFFITQITKGKYTNVVLSRRKLLQKEERKKKEEFFKNKKAGEVVTGIVKNYASFGVFIDLGGFDGLLHVSDMGWGKNIKPSEVAPKDKELTLMITNLDEENKKINLSLKALYPNPWDTIHDVYHEGDMLKGYVVKILPYGVFIHLDDNIEGFIHVSDMSWVKRVNHPKDLLKIRDVVECKILSIDQEQQRIALGMKQVEENPWNTVETTYPIGLKVTLPIVKVLSVGAIVAFENGIKGFIAKSNYAWNKQNEPNLQEGDFVECKVLDYDDKNYEVKLGIKQLSENPWEKDDIKVGTVVEGVITNVTDFGIFLKINENIEGLIPKSQSFDPVEHSSFEEVKSSFKKGNTLQAVIQYINADTKKLTLSIREIKEVENKQELKKHLVMENDTHHSVSLGDILDFEQ